MNTAFGFKIGVQNGAYFDLFSIGYHYHRKGDDTPCMFRKGISVTITGIVIDVGVFLIHD